MEKRKHRLIIAVCVLAAGLRFYRLGHQSLWVDEILTLGVSIPKPGLTIWDYLKYNIHGPLHSFAVYLIHFISVSDTWLRVPSALAGVAGIIFFYAWISRWMGRRIALLASTLFAINPMHLYYSQELRNYSFVLMFGMMACWFFQRLLERESKRVAVLFCVSTAMAALSNFTAAFLFAAHTLIYFLHNGIKRGAIVRWLAVCIFILVLISPWVYRIVDIIEVKKLVTPVMPGELDTAQRLRGGTTIGWTAIPYGLYVFSAGFSLGPSLRYLHEHTDLSTVAWNFLPWILLVGGTFGLLALLGFLRLLKDGRFWREIAIYLVLPFVFTAVLCWQNAKAFNTRYLILALPAYLCVVGSGLIAVRNYLARTVLFVLVAGISLTSIANYYFNGAYGREDVRGATRYLDARASADDCILAPTVKEVVAHYLETPRTVRSVVSRPGTPKATVEARIDEAIGRCRSLWYVRARPWVNDSNGSILRILHEKYAVDEKREFDGVQLFHFVERPNGGEGRLEGGWPRSGDEEGGVRVGIGPSSGGREGRMSASRTVLAL
jgi:4-amino-4-deoxy-L-arabinose transferase-like glycosyltransferase